jgi:hypothetical protein
MYLVKNLPKKGVIGGKDCLPPIIAASLRKEKEQSRAIARDVKRKPSGFSLKKHAPL